MVWEWLEKQKGRNNAGNVIFTKYNQKEIIKAIEKCCFNKEFLSKIPLFTKSPFVTSLIFAVNFSQHINA